jgi:hypothetical protein
MQSDATQVDDRFHAFASLNYADRKGAEHHYYDELARRGIISVSHRAMSQTTETHLRNQAPFEWSFLPPPETMTKNLGEFVCQSLARRPARFAGPPTQAPRRKFGIIRGVPVDGSAPDVAPLRDALAACHEDVVVADDKQSSSSRLALDAIIEMKSANVTTVICVCDAGEVRADLMPAASSQRYQPEWVLSTYIDADLDNSMNQAPVDQITHVLGVSFRNKLLRRQDMPWYWAIKEVDPTAEPTANDYYSLQARYSSFLLLASGIQMAGPRLTPERFQAALFGTRFPNPAPGAAPSFQARVGFDGRRHTMIDDGTLFWFDPGRPGTVDPSTAGRVCYIANGKRFGRGVWPADDSGFFADCT